jgi:hypothetical protein
MFVNTFFAMVNVLAASSPQQRVLLDIGCGRGLSTFQLAQEFRTADMIIGIDPDLSLLTQASQLVQHDSRVLFCRSTFEEFCQVCRPHTLHCVRMHYCLSERGFPLLDDMMHRFEHILVKKNGMIDIQDYSNQFLFSELQNDKTINPCFDWGMIEKTMSQSSYTCRVIDYPSPSSRRLIFVKKA